ncbi:Exodeoxyribonuclease 7 large subunit [uncultured archaeon]|nr:Exodeoxyribonuclease 7 large subunit [uncultured archaeon]
MSAQIFKVNFMNNTNKYLIACVMLALIGIISIAAIGFEEDITPTEMPRITNRMAGENVIVCGIVKSKSISPSGTAFMSLADGSTSIRAVFFKNEVREVQNSSRGTNLCIKGNIQIYNGTLEIVGRRAIN